MTTLLVVSVVALWVLVVVQGLVLLEAVRQISQIRKVADLDDRPVPISLGALAGRALPEPARARWSENGTHDGAFVLLSTDCTTCRLVAAGLPDILARFEQQRIVTVLQARDHDEAAQVLAEARLRLDDVVVDLESEYAAAFGVSLRPAAVIVRGGIVSEGAVVRNARQLEQLLEGLEPPAREEGRLAEATPVSTST